MKRDVMKKWVTALRSNKYKQGKECLLKDGKHCCLGVLCEIYNKDRTRQGKNPIKTYINDEKLVRFGRESAVLPETVRRWAGMHSKVGWLPCSNHLAGLNDLGVKFKTLANKIEKHYDCL